MYDASQLDNLYPALRNQSFIVIRHRPWLPSDTLNVRRVGIPDDLFDRVTVGKRGTPGIAMHCAFLQFSIEGRL
ncbi:hypothetical protein [Paraburkholderia sp. BCC1884]|uniref:hypothetical protein n=1 Tax=Paraburkholderia sp. BCC1884 TaxID=2562668 RepID=UPI0021B4D4A8|nr:hypothetical protein [Paraburkholderia sp. BCC1884]